MKKHLRCITSLFILALSPSIAFSEKSVNNLSPELRALLTEEMIAIKQGMQEIVPAYAAGDSLKVAEIAGQIKNSYILKQKLTQSQKRELHSKLPNDFIAKDQRFHRYAGMLEHVSEKNKSKLMAFYYSRLLESCIDCHTEYATDKFPNLSGTKHHY